MARMVAFPKGRLDRPAVVKELLAMGANTELKASAGKTAQDYARAVGLDEIVSLLASRK